MAPSTRGKTTRGVTWSTCRADSARISCEAGSSVRAVPRSRPRRAEPRDQKKRGFATSTGAARAARLALGTVVDRGADEANQSLTLLAVHPAVEAHVLTSLVRTYAETFVRFR